MGERERKREQKGQEDEEEEVVDYTCENIVSATVFKRS